MVHVVVRDAMLAVLKEVDRHVVEILGRISRYESLVERYTLTAIFVNQIVLPVDTRCYHVGLLLHSNDPIGRLLLSIVPIGMQQPIPSQARY